MSRFPRLLWAACGGWGGDARNSQKLIDFLEKTGVSANRLRPEDPSPIDACLRKKQWPLLWTLHKKGAPLHYVDEQGESALHLLAQRDTAVSHKHLQRFLADPQVRAILGQASTVKGQDGEQALHRACFHHNQAAVELLLAAGADANAQDALGRTPLRHALRKTKVSVGPLLHRLLEQGADLSIVDKKGRTPAQSVAGTALSSTLQQLVALRPQDVAGDSPSARVANKKLRARGNQLHALVEQTELSELLGVASTPSHGVPTESPVADTPPARRARRRL